MLQQINFQYEENQNVIIVGGQRHVIPCVESPQMDPAKDFPSPPILFENTGHT